MGERSHFIPDDVREERCYKCVPKIRDRNPTHRQSLAASFYFLINRVAEAIGEPTQQIELLGVSFFFPRSYLHFPYQWPTFSTIFLNDLGNAFLVHTAHQTEPLEGGWGAELGRHVSRNPFGT